MVAQIYRTIRCTVGRSCSTARYQCRAVHLYFAATSAAPEGNHKIKNYESLDAKSQESSHWIHLRDRKTNQSLGIMTLHQALTEHVKPSVLLSPSQIPSRPLQKPVAEALMGPQLPPTYELIKLNTDKRLIDPFTKNKRGITREFHLITCIPETLYLHMMTKMYQFIEAGRHVVEVHVRPKAGMKHLTIAWALENAMHLRPEVILQSMPKDSKFVIKPRTDGEEYVWVMGGPDKKDMDGRLVKRRREQFSRDGRRIGAGTVHREGMVPGPVKHIKPSSTQQGIQGRKSEERQDFQTPFIRRMPLPYQATGSQ